MCAKYTSNQIVCKDDPRQNEAVNGKNAPLYIQINQIFMIHCFAVNILNSQVHIVFGAQFPFGKSIVLYAGYATISLIKQCYRYLTANFFSSHNVIITILLHIFVQLFS